MATLKRMLRHLCTPHWTLRRAFPPSTLHAIEREIRASERLHGGEVRFAVEAALPLPALWRGATARERAIDLFSTLRMWDTSERNGVLIYLLLADHAVEIVADRGVHALAGAPHWGRVCHRMERAFRHGSYERGTASAVRMVTRMLARHYPPVPGRPNELPDKVVVL
ncbi:TPM domain-containing protein [Duganella sp. FT3S]|uniref:TPM domain-containing protein n=1 Tax=Rugamonas fusca TaxID=2758568 RepID=A0A7W2EDI5_9BURK|nr:TPM domain-containing protein [Rugamonas fusca]MBA5603960.1 TPM domain-containing protein [Rugamonas fusca]